MPYEHRLTSQGASTLDHADHNWEQARAYLTNLDGRDDIPGDASGVCCHDCRVIIWEA